MLNQSSIMPIEIYTGSDTMKKILVIPNRFKDENLTMTKEIIQWLVDRDLIVHLPHEFCQKETLIDKESNQYLVSHCLTEQADLSEIDYGIVLGGDGTIIAASREYVDYDIPLVGINLGNLGFLAEVEVANWKHILETFYQNDFTIDERMIVEACIKDGPNLGKAVNDIVITRQSISRMISYDVYVNGGYVNSYRADGVIVSTPTGSTAYNLSAGGPILSPTTESIVLTPICPHSLKARSIVLSADDEVYISFDSPRNKHVNDLLITMDGQEVSHLNKGDTIRVKRYKNKVKLLKVTDNSFFDILRAKLN